MSGAETARRQVVLRRVRGAETAVPKCPSPHNFRPCDEISFKTIRPYILYFRITQFQTMWLDLH